MNNNKAIELVDLCYNFKSDWTFRKRPALKNVSLDVYEGESFGYLGPNGAGKTTTIKCILGLIRASRGEIKIFGENPRAASARSAVGYLPEQPYFYDHLSVQETLELYARLAGVKKNLLREYIRDALTKVKIIDRAKSKMRALSKGLTQRVAMAQAIVAKPRLLILDEPFSGLDPIGRKEFKDLIFELKNLGTTILMSSHILSDVEFICDRASITVKGELKGIFDLSSLRSSGNNGYELLLRESGSDLAEFTQLCDAMQKEKGLIRMVFKQREKAMQAVSKSLELKIDIESFNPLHKNLEETFVTIATE